jgi:hypothetical protein
MCLRRPGRHCPVPRSEHTAVAHACLDLVFCDETALAKVEAFPSLQLIACAKAECSMGCTCKLRKRGPLERNGGPLRHQYWQAVPLRQILANHRALSVSGSAIESALKTTFLTDSCRRHGAMISQQPGELGRES